MWGILIRLSPIIAAQDAVITIDDCFIGLQVRIGYLKLISNVYLNLQPVLRDNV